MLWRLRVRVLVVLHVRRAHSCLLRHTRNLLAARSRATVAEAASTVTAAARSLCAVRGRPCRSSVLDARSTWTGLPRSLCHPRRIRGRTGDFLSRRQRARAGRTCDALPARTAKLRGDPISERGDPISDRGDPISDRGDPISGQRPGSTQGQPGPSGQPSRPASTAVPPCAPAYREGLQVQVQDQPPDGTFEKIKRRLEQESMARLRGRPTHFINPAHVWSENGPNRMP